MANLKSSNCENESDRASVLFTYTANDTTDESKIYNGLPFMVSCQKSGFEKPDAITLNSMKESVATNLNIDPKNVNVKDVVGVTLGAQSFELAAEQIKKKGMASNCAPSFDLNAVNSYNKYQCNYLGTGIDETGREVRNPYQVWKGTLPSCEEGIGISEETMDDIRKLVFLNAGGEGSKLDIDQFVCSVAGLPSA